MTTDSPFAHLRHDLPQRFPEIFAGLKDPRSRLHDGLCVDDGWLPLVEAACEALVSADGATRLRQIKEKFGALKIHLGGSSRAQQIAHFSDALSLRFCEICGTPGRPTIDASSWHQTLCEAHAGDRGAKFVGTWDVPPDLAVLQARWPCLSATRMTDIPTGWLDVLDALGEREDRCGIGAPCRHIVRTPDGRAEIDWPGLNDAGQGAVALVSALLPKIDPETGALRAGDGP